MGNARMKLKTLKTCACFLGQRASVMSRLVSAHEGLHALTRPLGPCLLVRSAFQTTCTRPAVQHCAG